jgi:hypothetical protein
MGTRPSRRRRCVSREQRGSAIHSARPRRSRPQDRARGGERRARTGDRADLVIRPRPGGCTIALELVVEERQFLGRPAWRQRWQSLRGSRPARIMRQQIWRCSCRPPGGGCVRVTAVVSAGADQASAREKLRASAGARSAPAAQLLNLLGVLGGDVAGLREVVGQVVQLRGVFVRVPAHDRRADPGSRRAACERCAPAAHPAVHHGSTLGLHPVVVLVVTIGAGTLFGMVGLTLAAPLTSAAVHISNELRRPKRRFGGDGRAGTGSIRLSVQRVLPGRPVVPRARRPLPLRTPR